MWCMVVKRFFLDSRRSRGKNKKLVPEAGQVVRATITFPAEVYRSLEEIARQKKVSLAWVVREAAERYLAERWPLFREQA